LTVEAMSIIWIYNESNCNSFRSVHTNYYFFTKKIFKLFSFTWGFFFFLHFNRKKVTITCLNRMKMVLISYLITSLYYEQIDLCFLVHEINRAKLVKSDLVISPKMSAF